MTSLERNLLFLLCGLLAALPVSMVGCGKSEPPIEQAAEAPPPVEPEDVLEPYDPPPLDEIDATANWVDLPVANAIERLRERLQSHPPLVDDAEAMKLRNNSEEDNEKIYSVMRQLPNSTV